MAASKLEREGIVLATATVAPPRRVPRLRGKEHNVIFVLLLAGMKRRHLETVAMESDVTRYIHTYTQFISTHHRHGNIASFHSQVTSFHSHVAMVHNILPN